MSYASAGYARTGYAASAQLRATLVAAQLVMVQQPDGPVPGVALAQQPTVRVATASGVTVTGDSSTVTVSWVPTYGDAALSGTLAKAAVAGVAAFASVALTWTVPSRGRLHFVDGALTTVDSIDLILAGPAVDPTKCIVTCS